MQPMAASAGEAVVPLDSLTQGVWEGLGFKVYRV